MRVGLDQRAMAAAGGVSRNSQLAYEAGRTPPSTDYLLAIQARGVDVPFLFTGHRSSDRSNILGFAEDADWIEVPTFDLAQLEDGTKGAPLRNTPIRRDWLNRVLGAETGLWLAAAPCDYPPVNLYEGDKVLLRDIAASELRERHLCIWRELESARLFVGRFSVVRSEAVSIDPDGEYWVGRTALVADQDAAEVAPVGRILGRPIAQIR